MAQPNCSDCGRFVGRNVRVLKYSPLELLCQGCTWQRDNEAARAADRFRPAPMLPTKDDVLSAAHDEPMDAAAYWSRARV